MTTMRSLGLLLAPLAVASPLVAGCGHITPSVPKSAIAVVGSRTISRAQFDALMAEARRSYAARDRPFPAEGTPAYEDLKRLAVRLLVEQAELAQEAPALGVQIGEDEVDARLGRLKEEDFGGSEERYRARLRAAGMTDAQVRAALRAELLAAAVRQAVTLDVTVGTQAVERYYEQHLADYSTPPARTIRHVLLATKVAADHVYSELRSGASFAALARRLSHDPTTRSRGGLLTLVEGRTAPSLDRVAFSLRTGTISRPFATRFGWELVEAASAVRPRQTTPFASVRDAIRRRLLAQRRAQSFQAWLARVRADLAPRTAFADGFSPGGEG